jgi:hypothetical protein
VVLRTNFSNLRPSVKELPEASIHHKHHGRHINGLLNGLDANSPSGTFPLTAIASDDRFLCGQFPDALAKFLAQILSWSNAAYFFDASTYLIGKLQAIYSSGPKASYKWSDLDDGCEQLKNEIFLANIIHLLRRFQSHLLQILVRKPRTQFDDLAHYLHAYLELRERLDKDCTKEWPSGQRPLNTTWPWNIRPSLVVLWV